MGGAGLVIANDNRGNASAVVANDNWAQIGHIMLVDGNDAVHDGSVAEAEAADLQDFTLHLLENVYTAPERLKLAAARRVERRQASQA